MALQLSEIQELYELATKKATTLYKMYLLVSRNIARNIVNVSKATFRNIYWAEFVQEHRNFRFTGIWGVSAE